MRKQTPKAAPQVTPLEKHYRNVAETESGIAVLQDIAKLCGFHLNSVVEDRTTGVLDFHGAIYNEGRRSVYLNVRAKVPRNRLADIENPPVKEQTLKTEIENVSK